MIGKNVVLRAVEPADLELLFELENNPEWWHLSNTVAPFSRFVLEQYIMDAHLDIYTTKQLRLMIEASPDNLPLAVGTIDLFDFDPVNHRAGVGVLVALKWQNKGYASEALDLLIDYAFNTLNLKQLYCGISKGNDASLHLFQKSGFRITGQREQWIRHQGKWIDEYFLQLLNPSF